MIDKPQKILVTGANGFVGQSLVPYLADLGHEVFAASRSPQAIRPHMRVTPVQMPDLEQPGADWSSLLRGIDLVVHAAGVAHAKAPAERHERINHRATAELGEATKSAGVSHFIFISSILAQSGPMPDRVLREDDPPSPANSYGHSKLAAERALKALGLPLTILRPVVIDGPDAKGNLALLRRLAALPVPLPFGSLDTPNSLLSIGNLHTAIRHVMLNPSAIGETYIVADSEPVALRDIVANMRREMGKNPNLLPVPPQLMATLLTLAGQKTLWQRIATPVIASSERLQRLGWKPRSP